MLANNLRNTTLAHRLATASVKNGSSMLHLPKAFMATKADSLENGEFIDSEVYVSQKLGSFTQRRKFRDDQGQVVDEIMEIELSKETRLESEAQLKERMAKFQNDLGVNLSGSQDTSSTSQPKQRSHLSKDNA